MTPDDIKAKKREADALVAELIAGLGQVENRERLTQASDELLGMGMAGTWAAMERAIESTARLVAMYKTMGLAKYALLALADLPEAEHGGWAVAMRGVAEALGKK